MEDIIRLGEFVPRFVLALFTAIVCGGLIGLERNLRKSGGLGWAVMICLGATLFMSVIELCAVKSATETPVDHSNLAGAVIIGIGLICMGIMLITKAENRGIYLSVVMWVVGAIGMIIGIGGIGHSLLALFITLITLTVMTFLHPAERQLALTDRPLLLKLTVRADSVEMRSRIRELLERYNVRSDSLRAEPGPVGVRITIHAEEEPKDIRRLVADLWSLQGVIEVEH